MRVEKLKQRCGELEKSIGEVESEIAFLETELGNFVSAEETRASQLSCRSGGTPWPICYPSGSFCRMRSKLRYSKTKKRRTG
jgi:hypothetical protein